MLLGLPAFMLVLYGYALNFDVRHVRLAVQDRDRSAAQPRAGRRLRQLDLLRPGGDPGARRRTSSALTERRVAKAVLVIPEGYGARPRGAAGGAAVQLLLDGADATTATTILGLRAALVAEANARAAARHARRAGRRRAAIDYEPRVCTTPSSSRRSSWCRA